MKFALRPSAKKGALVVAFMILHTFTSDGVEASLTPPAAVQNLTGWYDASDSSQFALNSFVTGWADESNNGNNLSSSIENAPSTVTESIHGINHQAMMFNGSEQLIKNGSSFHTGSSPSSMFIVASFTGSGQSAVAGWGSSGTGNSRYLENLSGSLLASEGNTASNTVGAWPSDPASPSIGEGIFDSGALNAGNDGTFGSAKSTTPSTSGSGFNVGNFQGLGWTGPIFEILVYNAVLSTSDRQKVEGYLACKYSIQSKLPSGHPYSASCPSGDPSSTTLITLPVGWYEGDQGISTSQA